MAYSTAAEVRLVLQGFVDVTPGDPDRTPASLSDTQLEYEIRNADEQINSVLRRRYNLPLPDPIPIVLKNLSIDIAAAQADMMFRGSREYASALHPMRLRYERALLILDRIATGDYPLYNEGEGPEGVGDDALVLNPYDGDVLLTEDVFPRGYRPGGREVEYSEIEAIPYYPYLRVRT
jgi:phage gp36-like protein